MINNRYIAALLVAGLISSPALADESVYVGISNLFYPVATVNTSEDLFVGVYGYDDLQPNFEYEAECFANITCNYHFNNYTTGVIDVSFGDYSNDMLNFLDDYCESMFMSSGLASNFDICKSLYY